MLDIQFIRENPQKVKQAAAHKNISVDIDKLLTLDEKRRELIQQVEKLRKDRNETAAQMKNGQPSPLEQTDGKLSGELPFRTSNGDFCTVYCFVMHGRLGNLARCPLSR